MFSSQVEERHFVVGFGIVAVVHHDLLRSDIFGLNGLLADHLHILGHLLNYFAQFFILHLKILDLLIFVLIGTLHPTQISLSQRFPQQGSMLLLLSRISLAIKTKRFYSIQIHILEVRQKWISLKIVLLAIVIDLLIHGLTLDIVEITDGILSHKPLLLEVPNHFFEVKILVSQAINLLVQVINCGLVLS